ncbi:uncharacterized protein LOC141714626 [Apium graveolens]|uniref:uncharacterized protein LOC141714626 n=1 Tax=Apium graveolens TaxID=4045 RepID=UPI003D7BAC28
MTSSQQPTRPNTIQQTPFDPAPLWSHVTVVKAPTKGGGNRVWICNYCHKQVIGSYTKVKSHLLQLKGNGVDLCNSISDQTRDELSREHEATESRKSRQALEAKRRQEYMSLPPGSDIKQQKNLKGTVESCFNVVNRDECDKELARMLYASALPFSLVKNPFFRRFCWRLSNSKVVGYVPPTYNRMRTNLLEQEKAHVNVLLQPFRDSWNKRGVSLCSDGWGDRQKRPLINVMAASGEILWADNVVQIITDNAANFKAVDLSIEAKYPHIFWTPCVVHSLNLALKSICEPTVNSNHFENFLDPNWKTFRKTNLESKADHVKECVISDRWWDKLEYSIGFTSPIYNMIRLGDTDTPCLHLIYDMWDTMIEEVREKVFKEEGVDLKMGESLFFNGIQHILEARWNKSNTPLHCMAHSLVPKYYSQTWLESGSEIVPRVAPNEDQEVSLNRAKCFKKMFPNPDDLRKVNAKYGMFSAALGFFRSLMLWMLGFMRNHLVGGLVMGLKHQCCKTWLSSYFHNLLLPLAAREIGVLSEIFKV